MMTCNQMLCARHWAVGCWLNAWTDASGPMMVTWYMLHVSILCGPCCLMGEGLGMGRSPMICLMCGLLSDGQKPHDLLRHGLCMC